MLKGDRIMAAHPCDVQTTVADLLKVIETRYPSPSSLERKKAEEGVEILQLLATELSQTLFVPTHV